MRSINTLTHKSFLLPGQNKIWKKIALEQTIMFNAGRPLSFDLCLQTKCFFFSLVAVFCLHDEGTENLMDIFSLKNIKTEIEKKC